MLDRRAFTLVELFIVIAITGVLSSVAIVNLGSTREKARASSAQASLRGIISAVVLCYDEAKNLKYNGIADCNAFNYIQVGTAICAGSPTTWPVLPDGWVYNTCVNAPFTNWFYLACDEACTTGKREVYCNNKGCVSLIVPEFEL